MRRCMTARSLAEMVFGIAVDNRDDAAGVSTYVLVYSWIAHELDLGRNWGVVITT